MTHSSGISGEAPGDEAETADPQERSDSPRVTQDGSQTLGESQSIPVASDSLIDSNEPENVNRLIDAVQASDTPYVVVKSEIFPPSDESISPTAASTSETAPVIPPTSTPASPVIVPIAPSPAAQTYTPTASSGPVLIGAIGNSAVGNSAQRATHPSVQRKDLAKEGVIRFFCGGLSFEADEGILSAYFEKYGPVVDVRVAREMGTGRHRGFGFVAVKSPNFDPTASEAVNTAALGELKQQVFADSPHEICARKITVQEENRPGDGSKPPGMKIDGFNEPDEEPRVFVANLDSSWDNAILKDYFSHFGEVTEVHIVTDQNGASRNFAFVTFQSQKVANKVCDGPVDFDPVTNKRRRSTKHTIRGRDVTVREADPKRARTRSQAPAPFTPYPATPAWFGSPSVAMAGQSDQMQMISSYAAPQGYYPMNTAAGVMMMPTPQMFFPPGQQIAAAPGQQWGYYSPATSTTYIAGQLDSSGGILRK